MQTGEYKHKQTKRFPLALITVQLGEFMVGMHFNTLLCLSVEIVNITIPNGLKPVLYMYNISLHHPMLTTTMRMIDIVMKMTATYSVQF